MKQRYRILQNANGRCRIQRKRWWGWETYSEPYWVSLPFSWQYKCSKPREFKGYDAAVVAIENWHQELEITRKSKQWKGRGEIVHGEK